MEIEKGSKAAEMMRQDGCCGASTLVYEIRKALSGSDPDYAPGDAYFGDRELYLATEIALKRMADGSAYPDD